MRAMFLRPIDRMVEAIVGKEVEMPRPNFQDVTPLGEFSHIRGSSQEGKIKVRQLADGRIDIRYFTAWDKKEPGKMKPTKGGFILTEEQFANFITFLEGVVEKL